MQENLIHGVYNGDEGEKKKSSIISNHAQNLPRDRLDPCRYFNHFQFLGIGDYPKNDRTQRLAFPWAGFDHRNCLVI